MGERDLSIYELFSRLVKITVEGKTFEVPENNLLLRCFQYIVNESVVPGSFCWNNECGNCELTYQTAREGLRRARGCQTLVEAGMSLSDLTLELRYWLGSRLK